MSNIINEAKKSLSVEAYLLWREDYDEQMEKVEAEQSQLKEISDISENCIKHYEGFADRSKEYVDEKKKNVEDSEYSDSKSVCLLLRITPSPVFIELNLISVHGGKPNKLELDHPIHKYIKEDSIWLVGDTDKTTDEDRKEFAKSFIEKNIKNATEADEFLKKNHEARVEQYTKEMGDQLEKNIKAVQEERQTFLELKQELDKGRLSIEHYPDYTKVPVAPVAPVVKKKEEK